MKAPFRNRRQTVRNMDVSLIICTRNRCRQLARCLDAVSRSEFERDWELIVVDNGSTDETAAAVKGFIDAGPVPTTYTFAATPGLGNARNAGLIAATGSIVAFTDDDCYPAPDFLSRIWAAFDDPSLGYASGRVTLHDPADHPMATNESMTPLTFPGGRFVRAGSVSGANMAFRRQVLLDIGGFDPVFGAGSLFSAEDLDAAGRASAKGWAGQYRPEIVVSHHHGRRASDFPQLMKAYGLGTGAYHLKLFLKGGKFLWFVRGFYQTRQRYYYSRTFAMWEFVGALRYFRHYLAESLQNFSVKVGFTAPKL
jgi:glycosyltransferase involved in cell wall biosynthesis